MPPAVFRPATDLAAVSDLRIRQYEPGDADAVWDLHERALHDVGVFYPEYAYFDADLRDVPGEYLDRVGRIRDLRSRQQDRR